jgi:hypothetical protein
MLFRSIASLELSDLEEGKRGKGRGEIDSGKLAQRAKSCGA